MKRIFPVTVAALAFALSIGVAEAGAKYSYEVRVDPVEKYATGAVGTARNSSDNKQVIYCRVVVDAQVAGSSYVACGATNAAGRSTYCQTKRVEFARAVQAINSDSEIFFKWKTVSGGENECVFIDVANGSTFEPKAP